MIIGGSEFARRRVTASAYFLMMTAWVFDFSSGGAGEGLAIHSTFLVVYLLFFLLLILLSGEKHRVPGLSVTILITLNFAIIGVGSGLFYEQNLYAIIRHFSTLIIFVLAVYSTVRVSLTLNPKAIRKLLAVLCLLYAVSSLFVFILTQGSINLETVRYQVIGGSTITALGAGILFLSFKLKRLEITAFLVSVAIVVMSVTRTYLVVFAFQSLFFIIISRKNIKIRRVILYLAIMATVVYVVSRVGGMDRWLERLFAAERFSGVDPTYLSRMSEWGYMWSEFTSSISSFLFGSGLGAHTKFYLAPEYGGHGYQASIGYGHNQHLSLLFIGGIIGGLPLLCLQLYQVCSSLCFTYATRKRGSRQNDVQFLIALSAMILCGFFVYNCFASSFGDRRFTLWLGIGTGLLLGIRHRFFSVENGPKL